MSFWANIDNGFSEEGLDLDVILDKGIKKKVSIDAWKTDNENEAGVSIATVILTVSNDVIVVYKDTIARTDKYAQEVIQEAVKELENSSGEIEPEGDFELRHGFILTFHEAIEKIFQEGGYIQGDNFAGGVYVTEDRDTKVLVVKDANQMHTKLMDFNITRGIGSQKYRHLNVATVKTLSK